MKNVQIDQILTNGDKFFAFSEGLKLDKCLRETKEKSYDLRTEEYNVVKPNTLF